MKSENQGIRDQRDLPQNMCPSVDLEMELESTRSSIEMGPSTDNIT